jgi:hypothetical protein
LRHLLLGIFDKLRDIRLFLEAVVDAVVVQIKTDFPELGKDCSGRDVIEGPKTLTFLWR